MHKRRERGTEIAILPSRPIEAPIPSLLLALGLNTQGLFHAVQQVAQGLFSVLCLQQVFWWQLLHLRLLRCCRSQLLREILQSQVGLMDILRKLRPCIRSHEPL